MGTLLRLEPPGPALARALLEQHAITVPDERAEAAVAAEIAYYREHHDEGSDRESLAGLRLRCAEVLRAALGPVAAGLDAQGLVPTLMGALRFGVFSDAVPALRALRRAGRRLVAVSNWDCSLPDVLERTGLGALLDGAVASAVVGASKPDPAIFVAGLEAVGVPAGRALHVGDSLEHDVAGARAAGIAAVLLRREGSGPAPAGVRVIGSLAELPGLAP